ncbi:MAG: AraC family transcriptional regulator [Lacunisphaera sp.]
MPPHEPPSRKSNDPFHGIEKNSRDPTHYQSDSIGRRGVSTFCAFQGPTQWPDHQHDSVEIGLLFDEALCDFSWQSEKGTQQQRLGSKQLWVVGAGQKHGGVWLKKAGLLLLHVEPDFLDEAAGRKVNDVTVHEFARMAHRDLAIWETASIFRKLCRQPHRNHDLYLESLGTIFATHVLKAHFGLDRAIAPDRILSPKQLRRVTEYIDAHLKDTVQVKDLAREACLSSYHFIRLFKRTTGLSPYQYLIRSRVEKAHELLRGGNHRVAEVAYEVGFCDQSHLDRYFRRHFGFSPRVVLKQGR